MFAEKRTQLPLWQIGIGLLAFLCHYTRLPDLSIGRASPFLLIPLTVSVSLFYGELTGLFYGLGFGLLCDCVAGQTICFNTLFFAFAGFLLGVAVGTVFNVNLPSAVALCVMTSAAYFGLKWLIFFFFPDVQGKIFYLLHYALPSALYTSLFIFLFYWIQLRLKNRHKKHSHIL